MPFSLDCDFLQRSAVLGGSLLTCSISLDRSANAAPVRIDAPVIDRLIVREITDSAHDIFLRGADMLGFSVQRTGFPRKRHKVRRWRASGGWLCISSRARTGRRAAICSTSALRRIFTQTTSTS
jgi:hypothetical protein